MLTCESCAHWQPYTVIYVDEKTKRAVKDVRFGCELCKTFTICGNYKNKEEGD